MKKGFCDICLINSSLISPFSSLINIDRHRLSPFMDCYEILICEIRAQLNKTQHQDTPGGVLPKDLGGGVRRASGNPYPISDENM